MIAELAAANAAFAVIKAAVANGGEIMAAGGKLIEYFDCKAAIQKKANEKAGDRPTDGRGDLEEFMALEQLKKQEEELQRMMIYHGRAGMWDDWLKFQAESARRRAEAKRQAERKEQLRRQRAQHILEVTVVSIASAFALALTLWGMYLVVNYLKK